MSATERALALSAKRLFDSFAACSPSPKAGMRNASKSERKAAVILHKGLLRGEELVKAGEKSAATVKQAITEIIESEPLAKIDYVEIVNFDNIETIETIDGSILAAVAVYIGKTRLIDNFIYES